LPFLFLSLIDLPFLYFPPRNSDIFLDISGKITGLISQIFVLLLFLSLNCLSEYSSFSLVLNL
jgi:hypothetical protein